MPGKSTSEAAAACPFVAQWSGGGGGRPGRDA